MASADKLTQESAKDFHYFTTYRDLPDETRSIPLAARKCRKSVSFFAKLAQRNNWVERVKALKVEQNERLKQAELEVAKEKERAMQARRERIREEAWDVFERILPMIKIHLAPAMLDKRGRPVGGKAVDAARLASAMEVMGRLGADMPVVTRAEIGGPGGRPLLPLVAPIIKIETLGDAASRKLLEDARSQFGTAMEDAKKNKQQ